MNKKILILVLSSDHDHYLKLENQWRKYLNRHPMITIKILKCKPNITSYEEDDTFYANTYDSYEFGIFNKIIQALQFYNKKYDLIFRTNVSSFFILDKFYEVASSLPEYNLYAGVKLLHNGIDYVSGAGCFFSPDVVDKLLEKSVEYKGGHDDVMIGHFLKDIPILSLETSRHEVANDNIFPNLDDIKDSYHIRIKLYDRSLEFKVFEHVYNMFYK